MVFKYTKANDRPAAAQKKPDPESYETKKQTTSKEPSQETDRKETGKKATGGEIAKNAVFSGLNQFNRGLASTLDFLLPTEFLGKYDVFSNLNDYYSGLADKYGSKLEESVSDRSKVVQMGAKGLESITAAAPNALLAVMTGGSSAAAQGSTAALTATSAAAGKSVAANAIQQTMKNPLYWSSVAQTLGNNYESAKANGANELQAIGSAFASSALNAAVEAGGGTETLPDVLKLGGNGSATAWAKSALTEGLEEPVQSAVSGAAEKLFFDKDKLMFSLSDRSAVINPGCMAEEFATGVAVGGILGAGQLAGSKQLYADPMELAKQGDYSGLIQKLDAHIRAKKLDELLAEYEKRVGNDRETSLNKLIEKARNGDKIELTEELEDVLAEKSFDEIEALKGKLSDRAARKWYLEQDSIIAKSLGTEENMEQRARKAFEIRNQNRMHARELMENQEKRFILDRDEPNKTFEELLADKMKRKGLSREEAIKDIIETAGKTRRSVNKSLGLE